MKVLRLDNGGEYTSKEFTDFCVGKGIKQEFTDPYTLAENGIVEQMNRMI